MADETLPEPVDAALAAHDAFEPTDDGYALTTTVFDARVTASAVEGDRDGEFSVVATVPTLSAATVDEVARVVEDDWFETFDRRLADVFDVATTGTHDEPIVERDVPAGEVTVTLDYVTWDAGEGVADAKAMVEFVEGTYAQGLIPGYEYRGEAATLRANAQQRGQEAVDDGGSSL